MVMLVLDRLRLGNGTEKKVQQASGVPCIPLTNRDTPHWSPCVARPVSLAPGLNPWGLLPKVGFKRARLLPGRFHSGPTYQGGSPEDTARTLLYGNSGSISDSLLCPRAAHVYVLLSASH